ncbi:hypothetical protein [Mesorhizobium huakuii]|uniref:Uncharacterized protein n=1 Tax=Mesorhizobium huakuii TaxID=28104 RepID=A0A7G6T0T4_9HYPH|nr:hypothetical protein [Mesorhizobium huakuii]QND60366.1 hypothetical protein HB778_30335 [Mesorhizobium huakuii]
MGRFEAEQAALHYRFTVKCTRDQNRKIEKAAKAAGQTPTTFVQQHFASLYAEPEPEPVTDTRGGERKHVSEKVRAAMVAEIASLVADSPTGLSVEISLRELGERCNVSVETASRAMAALVDAQRVLVITPGGPNKTAAYGLPGEAQKP